MGIAAARLLALCSACLLSIATFAQTPVHSLITRAVDERDLTLLKGNTHPLARAQFDQGAAPADLLMNRMLLVLRRSPEQESALRALLDDQQDKGSPNYHKWITPEEFGRQFAPTDQDMQQVSAWLQSHGFQIGQMSKGRTVIEFSGTAAQVQEALHTSIHRYVVNGEEHWANTNDPSIPSALTPAVEGILTLHNFLKKPQIHVSPQRVAAKVTAGAVGKPQVTFSGNFYGLGPADYATIYNINPVYSAGNQGGNVVIAVVGRSDQFNGGQDVSDFDNVFDTGSGFTTIFNGPDPGDLGGGEEAEATLDVAWAGAIAPSAKIDFVVSASTNTTDGVDLSELYIVDNNLGEVMTESFGGCEAFSTTTEAAGLSALAEQAAAEGITYIVSAGDSGAEGCDPTGASIATGPISVNILASTPFTIGVGGTMFNENGQDSTYWSSTNAQNTFESALSYIPEDVWNESCPASVCGASDANILAGGGGASILFSKPSWQTGVQGIPNDNARDLPDVSLTAAGHDPYLLCLEASCVPDSQGDIFFYAISGTSASAPSFAGIMALVADKMAQTYSGDLRQGQADYVLYPLAAAENSILSTCNASKTTGLPASGCVFNDVTAGNNAVPGEAGYGAPGALYQSSVGYDLATGLGSVNVANLVNNWSSIEPNKASSTTLSISPAGTLVHGTSVNVNISVASLTTGTPTGNCSLVGPTGGTIGFFTLNGGQVSSTTRSLPGGNYMLTAYYPGDKNFRSSTSTGFGPITVTPETSTTLLSVLGYPSANGVFPPFTSGPYGTFVYLRADVSGASGQGTPTGYVNFNDTVGSTLVTSLELNSEGNTATPNGLYNLATGSHSMTVQYPGDNSFKASTSAPTTFTITSAATITAIAAARASSGITLNATVSSNSAGNPPTGQIQFSINGAPAGTPIPVTEVPSSINQQTGALIGAQATATYSNAQMANGNYSAVAAYSGDSNYTASTSPPVSTSVQPDFSVSPSVTGLTVTQGGSGMLTLTVAAMNGFNGAVSFACSGMPSESTCTAPSVTESGSSALTITTTAATAAAMRLAPLKPQPAAPRFAFWSATLGTSFVAVFLLGVPGKRRWGIFPGLLLLAFITLAGCGGGNSNTGPPANPGTPVGTVVVTVTATSGSLNHTTTFSLTVQ